MLKSKLSTPAIVIGLVGVVLVISIFVFVLTGSAKAADGKKETPPASAPNMPDLAVFRDKAHTDNYTIMFGPSTFYYTKGDAPVTNAVDKTWSMKVETVQADRNTILLTILQNGSTVWSQEYN